MRPVRDPDHPAIRCEIIAGYVRWKAALQAQRQLLVDIRPTLAIERHFRSWSLRTICGAAFRLHPSETVSARPGRELVYLQG
ncbi:MAG: hypothetical protein H6976_16340 [Gammaproteobacteria bacterium]|nr:hypothetical protein [Gammaproteobacteria bacterium]